jgi:hypothetical protein
VSVEIALNREMMKTNLTVGMTFFVAQLNILLASFVSFVISPSSSGVSWMACVSGKTVAHFYADDQKLW